MSKWCVISPTYGVQTTLDDCYRTKRAARKAMSEAVRESATSCRRGGRRCVVVRHSRDLVEIKLGGKQSTNLWRHWAVRARK